MLRLLLEKYLNALSILFLIIFMSCSDEKPVENEAENIIPLSEKLEALRYYPLNNGNYWEYKVVDAEGESFATRSDTTYYSVEVLKDTMLSNGLIYKKIAQRDISLNLELEYKFERIDTNSAKIFRYSGNNLESLIENTLLKPGGKFVGSMGQFFSVFSSPGEYLFAETGHYEILNQETEIKLYHGITGLYINYRLAKDFGYVSSTYSTGSHFWYLRTERLVYANIGGLEYYNR